MAKRNHKVVVSHPVDGVVQVRRYHDAAKARASFERQVLGYGQCVQLVSNGDVVDSRGFGPARSAIDHPSYAL